MEAIVCKQGEKAIFTYKLHLTTKVPAFEFITVSTKSSAFPLEHMLTRHV